MRKIQQQKNSSIKENIEIIASSCRQPSETNFTIFLEKHLYCADSSFIKHIVASLSFTLGPKFLLGASFGHYLFLFSTT